MKSFNQFSQVCAFVFITTLFATAFTTLDSDHHARLQNLKNANPNSTMQRVIVSAKRMTALEKSQYDAQQRATLQSGTSATR